MINYLVIVSLSIYGIHSFLNEEIASEGQFKYLVSVWYRKEYRCSGTIIDRKHVLTSALCVRDIPLIGLSVIAGTIDTLNPKKQILLIQSVDIHYGLKIIHDPQMLGKQRWENDIAVLNLIHEIIWDSYLAPADLTSREYHWGTSHQCVVTGWQDIVTEGAGRVCLQWIEVTIVPNEKCNGLGLLKNEKCVHLPVNPAAGLSRMCGSPLICNGVTVGIILGGRNDNPKIVLNIFPYLDFIAHAIDSGESHVHLEQIRYIVTIWNIETYGCGGTILDEIHILTSSHCVRHLRVIDLRVVIGYFRILPSTERMEWLVDRIEIDPRFEDIAILTLAASFIGSQTISQAVYSEKIDLPTPRTCNVFRWRRAYIVDGETLMQLVWIPVAILNFEICQNLGANLGKYQFCASSHNHYSYNDLNSETIGNPIVCDGIVFGINIPSESPCLAIFTQVAPIKELDLCGSFNFFQHP